MTEYKVNVTSTAENDIIHALDYIENTLLNSVAADDLEAEIGYALSSLSTYPQRFKIPDDPLFKTAEIRFIIIKNYLAFYTINEQLQQVNVLRFLYGKSDWLSILKYD